MKLSVNREVTIGLSVLGVLLVVLGIVAVRRFMRPRIPPEAVIAREEEKRVEELHDHHLKHEADSPPTLGFPAAETPHCDGLQSPDDPGRWKGEEKHKEATASAPPGLVSADPPTIPGMPEGGDSPKKEREHPRTYARAEPTTISNDDRYSTLTPAPKGEFRERADSKSAVIQVSDDEHGEGRSHHMDRNAGRDAATAQQAPPSLGGGADSIPPAATMGLQPGLPDGGAAGMPVGPEAIRRHEKEHEHHSRGEGTAGNAETAGDTYAAAAAPGPRYGYGSAPPAIVTTSPPGEAVPMADGAMNYSAVPSGYAAENPVRRDGEVPGRLRERLRDDGMYEVQPNDSFWTISERVYGNGAYFRALGELNRGKAARPDRLSPGLLIATPPVAQLQKDYPDLCPRPSHREPVRDRGYSGGAMMAAAAAGGGGRTYVVQEGDTLSSIARYELGKVSRWAEIYQLNREALGKEYDYLTPGMRLVLPVRDPPPGDRTTRRSDDGVPLLR